MAHGVLSREMSGSSHYQMPNPIHNHPLDVVSSAKYLGVELSDNLSWNQHIDSIAAKGKRSLGFLRHNLGCCPHDVKTRCYNTFVRPIMEYASCVWDPTTKKNITKLESVQRSAAGSVMNNYSRESSVTNMLSINLEWKSLHHRRAISKVTMLYRITNHLVDIPDTQLIPSSSTTRGNSQKFLVPASCTTLLKGSFFSHTIRLWNNLPQDVVDSPTLDASNSRVIKSRFIKIKFSGAFERKDKDLRCFWVEGYG